MKYVIGAMAYYEIEAPEVSDEDWENGFLEPIYNTFWEKYRNGELPTPEMYEIECVDIDEENA